MGEKVSDQLQIEADRDAVWDIIVDIAAYPEWVEGVTDTEVLESNADGTVHRARFNVDARVVQVEYVLEYRYDDYDVSWSRVEGETVTQLDGRYELRKDGDGTLVRYALEMDVDLPVPGFMKKRAANTILERGLSGLQARAQAR